MPSELSFFHGTLPRGAPRPAPRGITMSAQHDTANGNPRARQMALLREAALECLTPDDMRALMTRMIERGKEGNVAAARLVLQYTLGKPTGSPYPDKTVPNDNVSPKVTEPKAVNDVAGISIDLQDDLL